ncbi:hypothetical protein J6590_075619 [Homalodisca vitripennis]|nr:hypothetical protein J6590_075619 [Homalodisca vitripennis]
MGLTNSLWRHVHYPPPPPPTPSHHAVYYYLSNKQWQSTKDQAGPAVQRAPSIRGFQDITMKAINPLFKMVCSPNTQILMSVTCLYSLIVQHPIGKVVEFYSPSH